MTYGDALRHLEALGEVRIRPGLDRVRRALDALGRPQRHYPCVLVGGTNGKGSTAAFLCAALAAAGRRVGAYTSPHLRRFEERIRVDGRDLAPDLLPSLVEEVRGTASDLSYFEFATAMALLHFSRSAVDAAVLEVGLGGRWDATNATEPVASVLTSIALDHREWLGGTEAEVAAEKAPILRAGRPGILGTAGPEAEAVVRRHAAETGARLRVLGRDFIMGREAGGRWRYRGARWDVGGLVLGLPGSFQGGNAACAAATLEELEAEGLSTGPEALRRGFADARWPGRLEQRGGTPPVLVDCAHNPAAAAVLAAELAEGPRPLVWVFSALRDKDVEGMARVLASVGDEAILLELGTPRAMPLPALEAALDRAGLPHRAAGSIDEALRLAEAAAGPRGRVAVAGSVYLAGMALGALEGRGERGGPCA